MNKDGKKMKVQEATNLIIQQIEEVVIQREDWHPKVYIGKTQNVEEREKEHLREGHPLYYLVCLATGSSEKINQLEKSCIVALRNSQKLQMYNERDGGAGNPQADNLYVAFTELWPGDDFEELPMANLFDSNKFPIQL